MHDIAKKIIFLLILLILIFVTWFLFTWYRVFHTPLVAPGVVTSVKVQRGFGLRDLAKQLSQQSMLNHPKFFVEFARLTGYERQLRFGEYQINSKTTLAHLLHNISHARGMVLHRITFIEGWTFRQLKLALKQNPNVRHFIQGKSDSQIMELLGHPNQHPEGMFFPDTYLFTWGNSDLEILKKAYAKMQRVLTQQWGQRAPHLPLKTSYQALIVASMVEKETAIPKERSKIAGVIIQRLEQKMRLQVDPTVLYGLGKPFGSMITKHDLNSITPYNTYRVKGLPPTPIDMPSAASIRAAMHPSHGNVLYYVARGDGSHRFSANYKDHLLAVAQYQKFKAEEVMRQYKQQHDQKSQHTSVIPEIIWQEVRWIFRLGF